MLCAMSKISVAVLISGSGSNLQALIDAAHSPDYPASIALVISNRTDAFGLTRAKQAGIPCVVISHTDFTSREAFDDAIHQALVAHDIQFVCLAGFMRVLTPEFVKKWHGKMMNIHPSLLPKHKGLHTHKAALDAGDSQHGCTVHWVSEGVDEGAIIAQSALDILPTDTPETLQHRVHTLEHALYPKALAEVLMNFS